MTCPACGAENRAGRKFCAECGTPLARACPACGTANEPGERFCGECGAPLEAGASAAAPARADPTSERRLVSVLFADLVGFTTLSEKRDAEEVRELLSRYFDTGRTLIGRYGGTVEKFIGDAVMAVWGAPVATEDDAERAVRAALDLTAAVHALGEEVGAPSLRARAGVLTGEAAVTLGAQGEGMVAGDLVNTASRIQSAAEPGAVLVGEATRRATEQTVVYEEAGSFELKGKEGLTPLWKALRVVSGVRGSLKSAGLEAPFVGRDRELRQIKDLFHASADEKRAHLVSVTGIAGIGKSRLAWEFYKYFDGLAEIVYWHRGRCLAYGEGVTYWALADMVRMRCRIAEDEEPASALQKLRSTLEEHILDPDERRFAEPRLAQLLGLEEHHARDREDLFAAWRLFFERLAETYPTVLAFEDMQWADASLLDFIEHLLDWSRNYPLYVITLARPELHERRPTWGAGKRNFSSLYLEPLPAAAMEELLSGLVPGLPPGLRGQILARAEGVPLYAVETVRMLLDRGLLVQEGPVYRPAGEIRELEVPETLHALVAARLDGLSPEERRLLQDGAVLGKTFTRESLASLSGLALVELEPLLAALVRKEVLSLQTDPRSPEHGQYGFLQDIVRHVAYETLARKERRARHLATAAYLASSFAEEDEIVEVVAAHYVAAYEAAPEAADAVEIKAKARDMLARAGDRASSLAAASEARRYFEQAAGLADEPLVKAELLDRAGWTAVYTADYDGSRRLLEASIALYEHEDRTHAAARVSARLAQVDQWSGRLEDALSRMERAFDVVSTDEPDESLALLAGQLSAAYWFAGKIELAAERNELALGLAESLWLPEVLAHALATRAMIAGSRGHPEEELALVKHALAIALENDLFERAVTAYFNLSDIALRRDRYAEALEHLRDALAQTRKRGSRLGEWSVLGEITYPLYMAGDWAEALEAYGEIPEDQIWTGGASTSVLTGVLELHIHRGALREAQALLARYEDMAASADLQNRAIYQAARAAVLRGEGRFAEALEAGAAAVGVATQLSAAHQAVKQGLVQAAEAALALGDHDRADELLTTVETLPRGLRPPYLAAQSKRLRARLAALHGDEQAAETSVKGAGGLLRELGIPFWLAVTLLEQGEWLVAAGRGAEAEPLFAEAGEIFHRLEARPWLERVEQVRADRLAPTT